jgi:hypothetical protein
MRRVLFKKWKDFPDNKVRCGMVGMFEEDFTHEGDFHQWAPAYEEFESGAGNYIVALIETTDGTIEEVLPKNMKIKFGVFCNQMVGRMVRANSLVEAINNLPIKLKKHWSVIMYRDEDGLSISVRKEFLEDMSLAEVVEDHVLFGDTDADIIVLNPSGVGVIYL